MKTMCQHYVRSSSHVSRLPQWFDTDIYWSYFAPLLTPINLDPSSVCNLWTGNKMVRRRRFPAAGELYCSMKPFQISINLIDILVSNLEITTNVFLLKTSKEPKNLGIFWTRGHGGSCQQSRNWDQFLHLFVANFKLQFSRRIYFGGFLDFAISIYLVKCWNLHQIYICNVIMFAARCGVLNLWLGSSALSWFNFGSE